MNASRLAKVVALLSIMLTAAAAFAAGSERLPVKPTPNDKCIVCGMFVAKYPDWTGEILFKDGRVLFFDGCKDLFKYLLNMEKYTPGKDRSDISAIYVTDYYDVSFIKASGAFYVIGSDVYGPMGRELVALRNESDAAAFAEDHKGKQIFRFDEITHEIVHGLE